MHWFLKFILGIELYMFRTGFSVHHQDGQKTCPKHGEFLCGNKMPTRCNRGFYCRSYCLLNMFRASLCPSSGAQEYYTVVAACGISCCGFQVAGLVWSWGLCVRFARCGSLIARIADSNPSKARDVLFFCLLLLRRADHSFRRVLSCVCVCVCVIVCDLEILTMRRPRPMLGCSTTEKNVY